MTDPIIRKINSLSKNVARIQSSTSVQSSSRLLYASFTNSETQYTIPNALTFLVWGYFFIDNDENLNSSSVFGFEGGDSAIYVPQEGYYNASLSITFDIAPGYVSIYLYLNDNIFQSSIQSGQISNSFSFSFFAEQDAQIQFAIKTDVNVSIKSVDSTVDLGESPILNLVKII